MNRTAMVRRFALVAAFCGVPEVFSNQSKGKGKPVSLLRLPSASVEKAPVVKQDALRAATDEDPATTAVFDATKTAPCDVVYGFGRGTVSPEKLVVRLSEKPIPSRVELLISSSDRPEGFRSLYATALKPVNKPQEFRLPKTSTRWIMLRWTPVGAATQIGVADVSVIGLPTAIASVYPFTKPPAEALVALERLKQYSTGRRGIASDEAALFTDAKFGRLEKYSFAEAALIASGVDDDAKRQKYLRQLDDLEAQARKALAGVKTPLEKGDALLRFLHAGPMKNKYVAKQTTLSGVLDTGTFNCVSSAVMYNVVGRRLGLDLRGIEVPDHAFAILYDGDKHADAETTNKLGFNPERDGKVIKEFEKETGFRYLPDRHRDKRREIGDLGLVAIIYANRSNEASKAKDYYESLLTAFSALALDAEFRGGVQNAQAGFATWSYDAIKGGRFAEALAVLEVGLELDPKNPKLTDNRAACWQEWLNKTCDGQGEDEGRRLALRLLKENPQDPRLRRVTRGLVIRGMNSLKDAGKYEDAASYVARNKELVNDEADARSMTASLYDAWARTFWKKDWDRAIAIYEKGLEVCPKDRVLQGNLKYCQSQRRK